MAFTESGSRVVSIRLPGELEDRLRAFAAEFGGTLSDAGRLAIARGLDQADVLGKLDAMTAERISDRDLAEAIYSLAYVTAELSVDPSKKEKLGELKERAKESLKRSMALRRDARGD